MEATALAEVPPAIPQTQTLAEVSGGISLSAQAELELELSLRGSLLVQQQRRIVQLEDELQRAWWACAGSERGARSAGGARNS